MKTKKKERQKDAVKHRERPIRNIEETERQTEIRKIHSDKQTDR